MTALRTRLDRLERHAVGTDDGDVMLCPGCGWRGVPVPLAAAPAEWDRMTRDQLAQLSEQELIRIHFATIRYDPRPTCRRCGASLDQDGVTFDGQHYTREQLAALPDEELRRLHAQVLGLDEEQIA